MKKDNTKIVAILLVIAVVIVLVVSLFNKKGDSEEENTLIVTNYSDFYTVNSCVYRVITYVTDKKANDLMYVISKKYKNEYKITEENILDFFPSIDVASTFVSKKMYYNPIKKGVTKYYVYGTIESETMDGSTDPKDAYFIVYLDTINKTFSIEPYDGNIFNEVK